MLKSKCDYSDEKQFHKAVQIQNCIIMQCIWAIWYGPQKMAEVLLGTTAIPPIIDQKLTEIETAF